MKRIFEFMKEFISYVLNIITPSKRNRIYVRCMKNSMWDKYDLLNYGSSNLLCYLNYYINQQHSHKIVIYIEYYDDTRFERYKELAQKVIRNNIQLRFIKSPFITKSRIKKLYYRICNAVCRFSCRLWFSETGDTAFSGKLWYQKIICFNYFISCKNDLEPGKNFRWKYIDKYLITGLLPAQIISSSTGVRLDHCLISGFPRNDSLLSQNKRLKILNYYKEKIGYTPQKIIIYAPTMRDYEMKQQKKRPLLGYDCEWLEEYVKDNKILLIYKLHPWQNKDIVTSSINIVPYISTYEFSFYDLLAVSDALISDYSSVVFDYLLTDKPLIFNLYDLEKYCETRGLSYDPYISFCPGHIATNSKELKIGFDDVISNTDKYKNDRKNIRNIIFKYPGLSTQNVYRSLLDLTEM